MSGWHPNIPDGGLAPNPNDPNNPAQAFNPTVPASMASPLYYGNGCDVRLRPHVLNSLISENLAILDRVGRAYNPGILTNTRVAIEYIVQRGLPKYTVLNGGPNHYSGALDPPATAYNNGMVVLVVPQVTNQGFIRVNLGPGLAPVYRNDGRELEALDWDANVPQLIAHVGGVFWMLGLCKSQVPLLADYIDAWVRTDGTDAMSHDGTANDPAKAFRTIQYGWNRVSKRYAVTPAFTINMRLGIPGTYAGAVFQYFGGTVTINGDPSNPDLYRISSLAPVAGTASCLGFWGVTNGICNGVGMLVDQAYPIDFACARSVVGSNVSVNNCTFESVASNPAARYMLAQSRSSMLPGNLIRMRGNNLQIGSLINITATSNYSAISALAPPTLLVQDVVMGAALSVTETSTMDLFLHTNSYSNAHGPQYNVQGNAVLNIRGALIPGDQPGVFAYNGVVIP